MTQSGTVPTERFPPAGKVDGVAWASPGFLRWLLAQPAPLPVGPPLVPSAVPASVVALPASGGLPGRPGPGCCEPYINHCSARHSEHAWLVPSEPPVPASPAETAAAPAGPEPWCRCGREGLVAIASPIFPPSIHLPRVFPWEHTCTRMHTQPGAAAQNTPKGSHICTTITTPRPNSLQSRIQKHTG